MINHRTFTMKLTRKEMIDVLVALVCCSSGEEKDKWIALHNKLRQQFEEQDAKIAKEKDDVR